MSWHVVFLASVSLITIKTLKAILKVGFFNSYYFFILGKNQKFGIEMSNVKTTTF